MKASPRWVNAPAPLSSYHIYTIHGYLNLELDASFSGQSSIASLLRIVCVFHGYCGPKMLDYVITLTLPYNFAPITFDLQVNMPHHILP